MADPADVQEQELTPEDGPPEAEPVVEAAGRPARRTPGVVGQIQRTVTDKMLMDPALTLPRGGRPRSPLDETRAQRSDRDMLSDMLTKPESASYRIRVHRHLPSHTAEGELVPRGRIHDCELMPFDDLCEEITKAWGGGSYRCVVYDQDGEALHGPDVRAIAIEIPIANHGPKLTKYAGLKPVAAEPVFGNGRDNEPESPIIADQKRQLRDQIQLDGLKQQQAEAEIRKSEYELKMTLKQREVRRLQEEVLGDNKDGALSAQLLALQTQLAQDRRDLETRLAQDRKDFETKMEAERKEREAKAEQDRRDATARAEADRSAQAAATKDLLAAILKVADKPAPAPDMGIKEVLVAMQTNQAAGQQQFTQFLTALIPVLTPKPAPPDTGMKDVLVAMQANQTAAQQQQTQLLTTIIPAMTSKPDAGTAQVLELFRANAEMVMSSAKRDNTQQQAMVANLINTVIAARQGHEMTPDLLIKIMDLGEKRMERAVSLAQNFEGGRGGGEEMAEPPSEAYDPRLGFLGNAGKAIFYGLKRLPDLMAQYPQLATLLTPLYQKIVGSGQPTEAQLAAAAQRLEQQSAMAGLPPPVAPPQFAPPQQPYILPPYSNIPPAIALRPAGPPPVQGGPPSVAAAAPPTQAAPVSQAVQQQIDAVAQLEGEAAGLNLDDEQILGPTAEERLRNAVTGSVVQACNDIEDKVKDHAWPDEATGYWPGDFKTAVVNAPSDQQRIAMIQGKCDPRVWAKLIALCSPQASDSLEVQQTRQAELLAFYHDLARFVDLNKPDTPGTIPVPAGPQPQQGAPAQVGTPSAPPRVAVPQAVTAVAPVQPAAVITPPPVMTPPPPPVAVPAAGVTPPPPAQ